MPNMSLTKNAMPSQEPEVRNKNFSEVALGYTEALALDEALGHPDDALGGRDGRAAELCHYQCHAVRPFNVANCLDASRGRG